MQFTGFTNGLFIIAGGIAAALVLIEIARRMFSPEVLRRAHDITGNLLSVVGTLYAVLLGMIVVDAMVRFQTAIDIVQKESNSLADIFLLAERLPEPQKTRLQDACKSYAHQVVEKEWPLMQKGTVSVDARKTAFTLARSLNDFEPKTEAEKVVYPLILEQMREVWDHRRERTGTVEYGMPVVEWIVLLVGGAVTVVFAGLFSAENNFLQRLLTTLAALLIGLNLYLISLFGYPFAGELSVSSRPFQIDIGIFEGRFGDAPVHVNERAGT
jgi:hypothetical protein